jgi:FkbM family methyltransferase
MKSSHPARDCLRETVAFFTRFYPFLSGCGRLAHRRFLASLVEGETEPKTVRLQSGEIILVYPQDFVGGSVYYFGDLDPKISWLCRKILRAGDTALDIGGNCGVIALRMASLVGKRGIVHSFEPQPRLASLIARSAALNHFDNLHVHGVALGSQDDSLELYIPDVNAGAASLIRREGQGQAINVPVKKTGPFLEQLGLGPIRLIKIDVEGFEESVFSGAMDYLAQNPAQAILFEATDHSVDFIDQPTTALLTKLGYSFLEIKKTLVRMHLCKIDLRNPKPQYGTDILAVHNGANAEDIFARVGVA